METWLKTRLDAAFDTSEHANSTTDILWRSRVRLVAVLPSHRSGSAIVPVQRVQVARNFPLKSASFFGRSVACTVPHVGHKAGKLARQHARHRSISQKCLHTYSSAPGANTTPQQKPSQHGTESQKQLQPCAADAPHQQLPLAARRCGPSPWRHLRAH